MADNQDRIEVSADLFHELSNMLMVALGSLDLLERQKLSQKARRLVDRAQSSTERAGQITQQTLVTAQSDFAAIQSYMKHQCGVTSLYDAAD